MLFLSGAGVYSFKAGLDSYLLYFVLASFEKKYLFLCGGGSQDFKGEGNAARAGSAGRMPLGEKGEQDIVPLALHSPPESSRWQTFGFDVAMSSCLVAGTGSR